MAHDLVATEVDEILVRVVVLDDVRLADAIGELVAEDMGVGMDRQSLRARRGLLAASASEVGAKVF